MFPVKSGYELWCQVRPNVNKNICDEHAFSASNLETVKTVNAI